MKKLILALTLIALITFGYQNNINAQEKAKLSLQSRINVLEKGFKFNKKLFKMIGENRCSAKGRVVKKITTSESFQVVAVPMVDIAQEAYYPEDFKCNLYSESGYKLSSTKSKLGMKLATNIFDNSKKRTHKVEFINPNTNPVKVRFYYVQDDIN